MLFHVGYVCMCYFMSDTYVVRSIKQHVFLVHLLEFPVPSVVECSVTTETTAAVSCCFEISLRHVKKTNQCLLKDTSECTVMSWRNQGGLPRQPRNVAACVADR